MMPAKFPIWILEYKSAALNNSAFLIWYTDTDEKDTDKLLTINNKILSFKTLEHKELNSFFPQINQPIEIISKDIYDIDYIKSNISRNILDDDTVELFINVINLFGDFVYQNEENSHLEKYLKDEYIDTTWRYFYDYIFFPKFSNYKKNEEWNKPQLSIDNQSLLTSFNQLISIFESFFEIIE